MLQFSAMSTSLELSTCLFSGAAGNNILSRIDDNQLVKFLCVCTDSVLDD